MYKFFVFPNICVYDVYLEIASENRVYGYCLTRRQHNLLLQEQGTDDLNTIS